MGVLALFASLLVLLTLPLISTSAVRSSLYRLLYQCFYWLLIADFILLSYIGQAAPESPFIEIGQIASIYYFAFFLIIIPSLGVLEKALIKS
jgi:ubiquinol-cytochrome c reductase cytochrome b subunit